MNAIDFSVKYRSCAPTFEYLISKGLSDIEAHSFIDRYNCISKGTNFEYGDEFLNLIANFDLSKVEIGLITLNDSIQIEGDFYILGQDECDPLFMYKFNHEISIVDLSDNEYVIYYCAESGDKFLDAIIVYRGFIAKHAHSDTKLDPGAIKKKAEECAMIAGSEKYLPFYEYALGCLG